MSANTFSLAATARDGGIREMAALSAHVAYALMCLTLCWGVLTATGWVRKLTGQQALRSGHVMLAAGTIAAGATHGSAFLLLDENAFGLIQLTVPFLGGAAPRHSLGIIALELMIAIAITAGLRRWVMYRNWLRFHQLAYVALGLGAVHSWLGAVANGHLAVVWLAGVTLLVPAITLTVLRLLPPDRLVRIGLIGATPIGPSEKATPMTRLRVSVDNQRCRRYGICQAEAPQVFELVTDGRLQYNRTPAPEQAGNAQAAARACPMQAIQLRGARR
ncbi:ferredoxin [Allokutzneria albata]|uniref:Ferredoxin n=1 Tax=Allokutzneria albata TaxID=211114 RepID=A0A1G9YT73_ALLAB|nr:ferredoxin [Allokutzneria albata]SDN11616.1 Ferredoxin [Allokutzneria albata]